MLDGKIKARFLLNGHGDLYVLLYNNSAQINLKIFLIGRKKKRYSWKRAQNWYSGMQIMTAKTTTIRTH